MSTPPWSFVAMQYHSLILNRTYRVYVTEHDLRGARVHGIVAAPLIPNPDQNSPEFYVDPYLDRRYADSDITTPAFLQIDRTNFSIPRQTITEIASFSTKWGMGTVPYSGRLVVHTNDGRHHELILLGQQDREAIRQKIRLG